MKLPAIQFYPGDWLRDSISGCSLAAQGLWLRILFLMHDSPRYGYLCSTDGTAIPPESVARRCGCHLEQYDALLLELDRANVFSRNPDGLIYSRRMVRDHRERSQNAERQKRFREKKALRNAPSNGPNNATLTPLSEDEGEDEVVYRREGAGREPPKSGPAFERFCRLEAKLFPLFGRVPGQRLSRDEEEAMLEVSNRPDVESESDLISLWMPRTEKPPQKLGNLLRDWNGALDRARSQPNGKPRKSAAQRIIESL